MASSQTPFSNISTCTSPVGSGEYSDSRNESLAATSSTPATETSMPEDPFVSKKMATDPRAGAMRKAATLTLEEQVSENVG